jgi:hypothetical protein
MGTLQRLRCDHAIEAELATCERQNNLRKVYTDSVAVSDPRPQRPAAAVHAANPAVVPDNARSAARRGGAFVSGQNHF